MRFSYSWSCCCSSSIVCLVFFLSRFIMRCTNSSRSRISRSRSISASSAAVRALFSESTTFSLLLPSSLPNLFLLCRRLSTFSCLVCGSFMSSSTSSSRSLSEFAWRYRRFLLSFNSLLEGSSTLSTFFLFSFTFCWDLSCTGRGTPGSGTSRSNNLYFVLAAFTKSALVSGRLSAAPFPLIRFTRLLAKLCTWSTGAVHPPPRRISTTSSIGLFGGLDFLATLTRYEASAASANPNKSCNASEHQFAISLLLFVACLDMIYTTSCCFLLLCRQFSFLYCDYR